MLSHAPTTESARPAWWQDLQADEFAWQVPDDLNIARVCADDQDPAATALIVDTGSDVSHYTFGELRDLSRQFAAGLREAGIDVGDRIGVMVPQGLEVLTAHLGAYRAGVVTVPLSVKFGPSAVLHRLGDSGARLLVVDEQILPRIRDDIATLPDLETVVVVGAAGNGAREIAFADFADRPATTEADAPTTAESPAIIVYTSGTTGAAKGALHAHRVLPAHMPAVRTVFGNAPQPGDVFWTPADWAWIGGLYDVLFPALGMGCAVVATPDGFTPQRALEVMEAHRVTASFIPPTALKQMRATGVDREAASGLCVRALVSGGESLGEVLRAWVAETFHVDINEFYGQTEMNLTIGTDRTAWTAEPGSMGRAFPGFTVRILTEDDVVAEPGNVGEICVATGNPGQFLGYWNLPDRTQDKVHDGWIHTGDRGRADADGNIWYEGRADDVISSAGYRIGPGEIEECLITHPSVAMAAVIGVPDDLRGEAVHAFVVPSADAAPEQTLRVELQNHVKHHLAFYQYPRQITFVDELPTTVTGKILRRELRVLAAQS
ncbi:AMP-binding protein [Gordonia phthalatica]|uniref:Acyl-CoA synthetase n=1 Tax=Gordonia phthalatica TaxID=1136941 RepID=A0A0N9N1C4_9ACTN|nr:AMP-binding protein [Gordonia phthalatica]ALG83925.1 acyl-CoA synthetase [Gordonia phthalatica]